MQAGSLDREIPERNLGVDEGTLVIQNQLDRNQAYLWKKDSIIGLSKEAHSSFEQTWDGKRWPVSLKA